MNNPPKPSDNDGLDAHLVFSRDGFELDLELTASSSQTVALLGPNGAGKSTILRLIGGLELLDDGYLQHGPTLLDCPAQDAFVPAHRRGVGVVFQDYLLFEHLTLLENVAFGGRSIGLSRRVARQDAKDWLRAFGLDDLGARRPSEISGGQAQRVALARTLAAQPKILLLDEPLAALDVESRVAARRLLADRLARFEGPRLLVTHDPMEAFLLADEVVVIENGGLTQRGTPDELRRQPATAYVAALAGTNLLRGRCQSGRVTLDIHDMTLSTDDTATSGDVLMTVHPRSIVLHPAQPEGSARNTWKTTVVGLEALGDIVRVELGAPLPIAADVTPAGASALGLQPGSEVWAAVKATEVEVSPA